MQNLPASSSEKRALQHAISRTTEVIVAICYNWPPVRTAHVAEDFQTHNFNVAPVPTNLFRPQRGQ